MIRQVWIAECDLCGHTEKAKTKPGRYNETITHCRKVGVMVITRISRYALNVFR